MNMTEMTATEIRLRQEATHFIPELWAKHAAEMMKRAIDDDIMDAMFGGVRWVTRVSTDEGAGLDATVRQCQASIFGDFNEVHS